MASATFKTWFAKAVEYEGKVCEDVPGDAGGPTRWGITIGRLATSKGVRVPARGTAAFEALKTELYALSPERIEQFYKEDYWDAVRGDDLPPGVDFALADYGLNSGPSRSVKAAQRLCGNPETGKLDDETLREICAFNPTEFIILFCDERERFLNAIVASKPSQRKFLKGWLTRVGDVKRAAIKLADKAPANDAVAVAMPKAQLEVPPVPSKVGVAAKSKSVWMLLTVAAGKVSDFFFGLTEKAGDVLERGVALVTDVDKQVGGKVEPLISLGQTLKINLGHIAFWATIATIIVVIMRHVGDKHALVAAKAEGEAP